MTLEGAMNVSRYPSRSEGVGRKLSRCGPIHGEKASTSIFASGAELPMQDGYFVA